MTLNRIANILASPVAFALYFFSLGVASLYILKSAISLQVIMQIFIFLTILIVIALKLASSTNLKLQRSSALKIGLLPVAFFIYLLVLSTGGLSSQFIITTHLFSMALAFLISPQISISFITATLSLFLLIAIGEPRQEFLGQSPFALVLYFVAYIALIPLSYIIAKEYRVKEEWANILEKQIATSKNQEETLLKNITDAVIVLNKQSQVVYINQAANTLTGFGREILDKNLFEFFRFKDQDGRALLPYQIPIDQSLNTKTQSYLENIRLLIKEKFLPVDLKIIPVIGLEGPLGTILVFKDRTSADQTIQKKKTATFMSLARFLTFLASQKNVLLNLKRANPLNSQLEDLIRKNEDLKHLSEDFVYTLRIESGEVGALTSLVDLGEIVQELLFELKPYLQGKNLILIPRHLTASANVVAPKSNLRIPVQKKVFPEVYIIGNISWIKDSLSRIFKLIFLLSQSSKKIEVEVVREQGLGLVRIYAPIYSFWGNAARLMPDLFEKFYGQLQNMPELSETSGLEGYIAKNLIERMGGNIRYENRQNPPALVFTITFGLKEVN